MPYPPRWGLQRLPRSTIKRRNINPARSVTPPFTARTRATYSSRHEENDDEERELQEESSHSIHLRRCWLVPSAIESRSIDDASCLGTATGRATRSRPGQLQH